MSRTLIAITALIIASLSGQIASAEPGTTGQSLVVSPAGDLTATGPKGGPFTPLTFQYHVSTTTEMARYAVSAPAWIIVKERIGKADPNGVTVTLTINPAAARLQPGNYQAQIAFTNVTNGRGTTSRAATLTVLAGSTSPESTGSLKSDTGSLKTDSGELLLDDRGQPLLAR